MSIFRSTLVKKPDLRCCGLKAACLRWEPTADGAAGHTAIYNTATGKWAAGPDFPNGNDMADAPAAVLPDGNILAETSPGVFNSPVTFYEFNGTKFINAPLPKHTGNAELNTSYLGRLLVLPTGQILYTLGGWRNYRCRDLHGQGNVSEVLGAGDHDCSEHHHSW